MSCGLRHTPCVNVFWMFVTECYVGDSLVIEGAAVTPYLLYTFYRVLLLLDATCLHTVCVCGICRVCLPIYAFIFVL